MEISSAAATGRASRRVRVLSRGDCMLVEGFCLVDWFVVGEEGFFVFHYLPRATRFSVAAAACANPAAVARKRRVEMEAFILT